MEYTYISIGVKNSTIEKIGDALGRLRVKDFILRGLGDFEIKLDLMDFSVEYQGMSKFLAENNLQDDTLFFNYFDINPFGLRLDFQIKRQNGFVDILEPLIFILGQKLSTELGTECIVMLNNNTIPVGLFNSGTLIETFEIYNSDFFKGKIWRPNL